MKTLFKEINHGFNKFINNILLKRKHNKSDLLLKHHNIYVLPSKFGLAFLCFNILIFILGSNYQNNLILLSAYLLISFFIISILQSYFNLMNTHITFVDVEDGIEKTGYALSFTLSNENQAHSLIIQAQQKYSLVDVITADKNVVKLQLTGLKRGKHKVSRIKILSRYPFGLMSIWSYCIFPKSVYIYPTPLPIVSHGKTFNDSNDEQQDSVTKGSNEFYAIREHELGESFSRISWKHYAKTQQFLVKEFSESHSGDFVFNLIDMPGDFETKLSHLSYLVNQAFHDDLTFGLMLPGKKIPASKGYNHLKLCLRTLSEA